MTETANKQKLRSIAMVGLAAAMICVISPISIPIGDVPLSLATFVILITAGLLGPYKGTAAVAVYLLIGSMGLPVFSGFSGGLGRLIGPTGGYLVGYLPLAFTVGLGKGKALPMIAGTALLYIMGTLWYTVFADVSFFAAAAVCVVPFLPLDSVKIAAAAIAVNRIKKHGKK